MKLPFCLLIVISFFVCPVIATDVEDLADAWLIKCNVNGAEVFLDGVSVGYIENNELIVPVTSPYERFMIIRGQGFDEIWQKIYPPMSGHAEEINIWIDNAPVSEYEGRVKIDSTPRGAKVYYQEDYLTDGEWKVAGFTPVVIDYTSVGWHRVKVWKEGYELEEKRVLVSIGNVATDNWFKLVPGDSEDPIHILPTAVPTVAPTPVPTQMPVATAIPTSEVPELNDEMPEEDIEFTFNGFYFVLLIIVVGGMCAVVYSFRITIGF